jgi:hypothetical protein
MSQEPAGPGGVRGIIFYAEDDCVGSGGQPREGPPDAIARN